MRRLFTLLVPPDRHRGHDVLRTVSQIDLVQLNGWDESLSALQDTDLFPRAAEITTFASLTTEPVRVDTGAPDRITYLVAASLIGKAQFLRKHWHRIPISRRLAYLAQILVCAPLLRALRRRWKVAALRRQRSAAADLTRSLLAGGTAWRTDCGRRQCGRQAAPYCTRESPRRLRQRPAPLLPWQRPQLVHAPLQSL